MRYNFIASLCESQKPTFGIVGGGRPDHSFLPVAPPQMIGDALQFSEKPHLRKLVTNIIFTQKVTCRNEFHMICLCLSGLVGLYQTKDQKGQAKLTGSRSVMRY